MSAFEGFETFDLEKRGEESRCRVSVESSLTGEKCGQAREIKKTRGDKRKNERILAKAAQK